MFGIFKKKNKEVNIDEERKKLQSNVGGDIFVAKTMVAMHKASNKRFTMAALAILEKEPLKFNATLLPTDAEYVHMTHNGNQAEEVGLIKMSEFASLLGLSKESHQFGDLGEVEYYRVADNNGLTFKDLTEKTVKFSPQ